MRRGALVLILGIAVGIATHLVYFRIHRPFDANTLEGQLSWMKSELQLSDTQFARIKELHQASSPRLIALASEVAQMQSEFAAFENTRRTSDKVDFIEFAQFVQVRRNINRECLDSTRQLVLAAAGEMNPSQREHYFGIVAATNPQISQLNN
jgi:arginine/lysine/ornithine decarboxylase